MKITITDIKQLEKVIKEISRVTDKKKKYMPMPILTHFFLDVKKEKTIFFATDLETGIKIDGTAFTKVHKTGSICIPAVLFYQYIKGKKGELVLETDENNYIMLGSPVTLKIAGLNPSDFPAYPKIEKTETIVISALAERLKRVSYAVGDEDTRYTLHSVCLDLEKSKIIATDGHRLTVTDLDGKADFKLLIPIKTIKTLEALKGDVELTIAYDVKKAKDPKNEPDIKIPKHAIFSYSGGLIQVVSRCIEGSYPDYEQVIPKEIASVITVDVILLRNKIKAVSNMVSDNNAVSLSINKANELVITAYNPALGEGRETMTVSSVAGDKKILQTGFTINYKYLFDCSDNIEEGNISFKLIRADSPICVETDIDHDIRIISPLRQ